VEKGVSTQGREEERGGREIDLKIEDIVDGFVRMFLRRGSRRNFVTNQADGIPTTKSIQTQIFEHRDVDQIPGTQVHVGSIDAEAVDIGRVDLN
jgi:hypothetical protein